MRSDKCVDLAEGDDCTAVNGVKLTYCGRESWYSQAEETVEDDGKAADWRGTWSGAMCDEGQYVYTAALASQDHGIYADDLAATGLKFRCAGLGAKRGIGPDPPDARSRLADSSVKSCIGGG